MGESTLKVCEFNLENLFISLEYYENQSLEKTTENEWKNFALAQFQMRQKPLAKLRGVAKAILDIDADVFMLVEVGGKESLEHFNRLFLNDQYITYFVEGNSRRSIDLSFLVKKGLPYRVETRSNKEIPIEVEAYTGKYQTRFSRDVAELSLHDDTGMRLILMLVHLKSKISSDQDFRGNDVRTAEANALAELYRARREEFPEVPIVMGGDFNSDLQSPEFANLLVTDLKDFHAIKGSTEEERVTLIYFDYKGAPNPQVLDYLLISPHLHDLMIHDQSFTYRYKTFYDVEELIPEDRKQRHLQPSDHFPIVVEFKLP